jgi:hydrogenase maturation protease
MNKILIYGYGNPGLQDDSLGVFIAEKIEEWAAENKIKNVFTDTNYQLNVEDAYTLKDYQTVIFVDASKEKISNFKFTKLYPVEKPEFTMHSVSPEYVIGLCNSLFGLYPKTYLMHVKGYEWEFMKELSFAATENMEMAYKFLVQKIIKHNKFIIK